MRGLLCALPILMAANAWAVHGIIQTTDGKTFEGDIRVEAGAFVIGDTNVAEKVELQRLAMMRIQPPSKAAAASGNQTPGLRASYFTNLSHAGQGGNHAHRSLD